MLKGLILLTAFFLISSIGNGQTLYELQKTKEEAIELQKSYNYDEAIELLFQVINSLEEPLSKEERLLEADCYNNISTIFRNLKFFDEALEYNQNAIDLVTDEPNVLGKYYHFRGNAYAQKIEASLNKKDSLNQTDDILAARENYKKALKIYNKNNDKKNYSILLSSIGYTYIQTSDLDTAEEWVLKSKEEASSFEKEIGPNYLLARIYNDKEEYHKVIDIALNNISLIDLNNLDESYKENFHYNLYEAYKKESRITEALYHFEQYERIANANTIPIVDYASIINTKEFNKLREKAKNLESQVDQNIIKAKNAKTVNIILISSLLALSTIGFFYFRNKKIEAQNLKLKIAQREQQSEIDTINAMMDGREAEKKEIGRFLHDHVSALVNTANIQLEVLANEYHIEDSEKLNNTQVILDDIADKVRNLSHQLLSNVLQKYGLTAALEDLGKRFTSSMIKFELHSALPENKRYQEHIENKVYSIVQELCNNIIKHSNASEAHIFIEEKESHLYIMIEDNGIGFKEEDIQKGGIGLHQVKTRINSMGGNLVIDTTDTTKINIYIPLAVANIY